MAEVPTAADVGAALVVIPTYNEVANLSSVVLTVRGQCPTVHVLVVDDNSPDGTGDLADQLASDSDGAVHVLHRHAKQGLGAAYRAGFAWALQRGYAVVAEMDADGSHDSRDLNGVLAGIAAGADVSIGSRYVAGSVLRNWPRRRYLLSRMANRYAQVMLGMSVRDITAGYRAYRRHVLEAIDLDSVTSRGYSFQIEMAWRAAGENFVIVERPITFVNRQCGRSKMRTADMAEAFGKTFTWGMRSRTVDRMPRVSTGARSD